MILGFLHKSLNLQPIATCLMAWKLVYALGRLMSLGLTPFPLFAGTQQSLIEMTWAAKKGTVKVFLNSTPTEWCHVVCCYLPLAGL